MVYPFLHIALFISLGIRMNPMGIGCPSEISDRKVFDEQYNRNSSRWQAQFACFAQEIVSMPRGRATERTVWYQVHHLCLSLFGCIHYNHTSRLLQVGKL